MTTEQCDHLSEKMPLVASGAALWTPEEAAHLAGCEQCAAEWRLIQGARAIGERAAAGLDHDRLATRVLSEVTARRRRARWARGGALTLLAAAAAVILMVWTGGEPKGGVAVAPDSSRALALDAGFHLPLAELEPLDSEQLQVVLDGLDVPVEEVDPGPPPSFTELDDSQLERVLRSLEG